MIEKKTKVKICGITRKAEADYLNNSRPDYAGFVFFPKSKRNVSAGQAKEIMEFLEPSIRKVAVMVSPDVSAIETVTELGIDILQIHKELKPDVLKAAQLPVWYAFNITDPAELKKKEEFFLSLDPNLADKIKGIVVDAANFGSGQTFDWESGSKELREHFIFKDRLFILAGGLNPENVRLGIEIFHPDVVDVSSGVEKEITEADKEKGILFAGKDPDRIERFCRGARE